MKHHNQYLLEIIRRAQAEDATPEFKQAFQVIFKDLTPDFQKELEIYLDQGWGIDDFCTALDELPADWNIELNGYHQGLEVNLIDPEGEIIPDEFFPNYHADISNVEAMVKERIDYARLKDGLSTVFDTEFDKEVL